mgnify:CR=1 FL=1|jgi:hypothetical protein
MLMIVINYVFNAYKRKQKEVIIVIFVIFVLINMIIIVHGLIIVWGKIILEDLFYLYFYYC